MSTAETFVDLLLIHIEIGNLMRYIWGCRKGRCCLLISIFDVRQQQLVELWWLTRRSQLLSVAKITQRGASVPRCMRKAR